MTEKSIHQIAKSKLVDQGTAKISAKTAGVFFARVMTDESVMTRAAVDRHRYKQQKLPARPIKKYQ